MTSSKVLHRGANDDITAFARAFLEGRLKGFRKDMRICLTGVAREDSKKLTHAYFPAFMSCCGMLEYLSGLYAGRLERLGAREIVQYSRYLPKPDYDDDLLRIFYVAFRNAVAHRGVASGVWIDRDPGTAGRRLSWTMQASENSPALQLLDAPGVIKVDSPWPCAYTHKLQIRLGRLWRDIHDSAPAYLAELEGSAQLQDRFARCMRHLYP
jgi:hypothetical protein